MQLVAYGAQDIYLTGNPQITFFKVVYRRHTNFAMESIAQTLNGTVGYSNSVTATISRNGDLINKMYLEASIAIGEHQDACANPGSALIDEAVLEIGGQQIDKHYGHWMEVWAELTEPNPTYHSGTQNAATGGARTTGTLFQNMAGMGGVSGQAATIENISKMYIPFYFWFCRNPGLALPLIALQYHEVKLKVTFAPRAAVVQAGTSSSPSAELFVDYIYLDTDERRRFAQVSHEYLIEQLQYQTTSAGSVGSYDLNFNHPVKELIWTGGTTTTATEIAGPSTPLLVTDALADSTTTFQLKLNGHDRMAVRNALYFTRQQVHDYHTGCGGIFLTTDAAADALNRGTADSIAVYSFALKPEEHQPSGTCNFSRIDNAQLVIGTAAVTGALNVYAINYNVLRIMSGMGGLAYSN